MEKLNGVSMVAEQMRELTLSEVDQVSGANFFEDLTDFSGTGAALGSLGGAVYSGGTVAGIGAGAAYGGVLGGSFAVGYGIGTGINAAYDWASSSLGGSGSLGGDIYDLFN